MQIDCPNITENSIREWCRVSNDDVGNSMEDKAVYYCGTGRNPAFCNVLIVTQVITLSNAEAERLFSEQTWLTESRRLQSGRDLLNAYKQ